MVSTMLPVVVSRFCSATGTAMTATVLRNWIQENGLEFFMCISFLKLLRKKHIAYIVSFYVPGRNSFSKKREISRSRRRKTIDSK